MKGGIPRKGLIAHWQNSDASSLVNVFSTFYLLYALVTCMYISSLETVADYTMYPLLFLHVCLHTVLQNQSHIDLFPEDFGNNSVWLCFYNIMVSALILF